MNLENVQKFVNQIMHSNSRKHKEECLARWKSDKDILYFLDFLFNFKVTTGLSELKYEKKVPMFNYEKQRGNIFEYIKANNTGSDKDIAEVKSYALCQVKDEHKPLFKGIVTKNFPIGIQVSTINKVIPDLLPTFEVQLAERYDERPQILDGKDFTVTLKMDGIRCIAIKENGKVNCFARSGQVLEGLVDIEKELLNLPLNNFVLDGELALHDVSNLSSKEEYQAVSKIVRKDGVKKGIMLLAFDILKVDNFNDKKTKAIYSTRRAALDANFKDGDFVRALPVLYSGKDVTQIPAIMKQVVALKKEGLMINLNDSVYEFKRTWNLLKVKEMHTLDLLVIGFEEGTNKYTGMLGSLLVKYKGHAVKVGSGFTEAQRKEFWKEGNKMIGKTVEVQYFEETKNDKGTTSLRFPVFLEFRFDK